MGREKHISKALLFGFRTKYNAETREIASVRRAARLQSMRPAVNIPVHFSRNNVESNNNKLKAKKGRKQTGSIGTIKAVKALEKMKKRSLHKPSEVCHRNTSCVQILLNLPLQTL